MTYSIVSQRIEERYIDREIGWIDDNTPIIENKYQFTTWTLVEFGTGESKTVLDIPHFMTSDINIIYENIERRLNSEINNLENGN
jgi:hypothetical protein